MRVGDPGFPLPFPNKDEGTKVVLVFILLLFFSFSSILACLLRKGILKKKTKMFLKKKATPTPVSVYSQFILCSVV